MSKRQQYLSNERTARKFTSTLGGQRRDNALIARKSETLFWFNKDAEAIVLGVDNSTYEYYTAVKDFLIDLGLRVLNDYEALLPKADDEQPSDQS